MQIAAILYIQCNVSPINPTFMLKKWVYYCVMGIFFSCSDQHYLCLKAYKDACIVMLKVTHNNSTIWKYVQRASFEKMLYHFFPCTTVCFVRVNVLWKHFSLSFSLCWYVAKHKNDHYTISAFIIVLLYSIKWL